MKSKDSAVSDVSNSDEASDSDSDSDSDSEPMPDSGYGSVEEDPEQEAAFYHGFIDQREVEGPTMANHDENTKKMTYPEEERWNKYYYHDTKESFIFF
jgi:hypothetical protein